VGGGEVGRVNGERDRVGVEEGEEGDVSLSVCEAKRGRKRGEEGGGPKVGARLLDGARVESGGSERE